MYGSAYTMEKEFYGAVIIDSGVRWNNETVKKRSAFSINDISRSWSPNEDNTALFHSAPTLV